MRQELRGAGPQPDELRLHLFSAGPRILPTHNAARAPRLRAACWPSAASPCTATPKCAEVAAGQSAHARRRDSSPPTRSSGSPRRAAPAWLRETGLALDDARLHPRPRHPADRDRSADLRRRRLRLPDRPAAGEGGRVRRAHGPAAGREPAPDGPAASRCIRYRPQRRWLALISTGDRHAIASRGSCLRAGRLGVALEGLDRPALHAPIQRIARRWPQAAGAAERRDSARRRANRPQAISAIAMRCGGCGAKVGATVLSRALASVRPLERDDVLIGLHAPDDAAVMRVPPGKAHGAYRRFLPRLHRRPLAVRPDRRQPRARRHLRHGRARRNPPPPSPPCRRAWKARSRTPCSR
ncbi:MAG: hypothetical protein MZW92_81300 [Comamonadaceae bacterium]|nr:hypothetical protein [Comamonadaceae bacterium]